jgi:glycosyltransferase involved in cell wall biosynthesis
MKLSILIPTLESRWDNFLELRDFIRGQVYRDVEIKTWLNNGEESIGYYRQKLLERATGDYIAFIDDDDMVPDNYVQSILKAIEDYTEQWGSEPDAVGFNGLLTTPSGKEYPVEYKHGNEDIQKGNTFKRGIWHLQPVKREIALEGGFPLDRDRGEDMVYSQNIKPLIKTSVFIDKTMYYYRTNYEI